MKTNNTMEDIYCTLEAPSPLISSAINAYVPKLETDITKLRDEVQDKKLSEAQKLAIAIMVKQPETTIIPETKTTEEALVLETAQQTLTLDTGQKSLMNQQKESPTSETEVEKSKGSLSIEDIDMNEFTPTSKSSTKKNSYVQSPHIAPVENDTSSSSISSFSTIVECIESTNKIKDEFILDSKNEIPLIIDDVVYTNNNNDINIDNV
jgi:hypothetical protein